jgi:putative transposase
VPNPRKESNAMKTSTMMTSAMPRAPVGKAWEEVSASFDRFCLAAGIETLGAMMEADAECPFGSKNPSPRPSIC